MKAPLPDPGSLPPPLAAAWPGGEDASPLAARLAAEAAVSKAPDLATSGVDRRAIEVVRELAGRCAVRLEESLTEESALPDCFTHPASLSHHGDYALALVAFPSALP